MYFVNKILAYPPSRLTLFRRWYFCRAVLEVVPTEVVLVTFVLPVDLFDFPESVEEIDADVVSIGLTVDDVVSELVVKGIDFKTSALILITSLLKVVENKLFFRCISFIFFRTSGLA